MKAYIFTPGDSICRKGNYPAFMTYQRLLIKLYNFHNVTVNICRKVSFGANFYNLKERLFNSYRKVRRNGQKNV